MGEATQLFTRTSRILRDTTVIELQKSNDFLRNRLSLINKNPFFGYKVKIKQHVNGMTQTVFPETNGKIYSLNKCDAWIMYKDENNNKKMKWIHIDNIEFIDSKFDSYF